MALSDISRKQARSDVLSRLDEVSSEALDPAEINRWLDMGQFDFFNKMAALAHKWYGTSQSVSITAPAGAVTATTLEGAYAPTKIAQISKLILADGTTIVRPTEFNSLEHMLGNSNFDNSYHYAWYGEKLYVFTGTSASALSTDSSTLYFVRKPDEMGGDTNVFTVAFASAVQNDTITVDGIQFIAKDAATTEVADFITTGTDTADGDNFEDVLENLFQTSTGVSASSTTGTVTITGAKTVTSSNGTRLAVAQSTASMLDVPTEYTDLVIMYAQARALGKLKRQDLRLGVENDISQMYGAIHGLFAEELQIRAAEKPAGIISQRRLE